MNNDKILLQILNEVQETNTRVTNLEKDMKDGFEKVNTRVTNLEKGIKGEFEKVDTRVTKSENDIKDISSKLERLNKTIKEIDLTVVEIFNMLKQQGEQNKNEIDKIKEKHEVIGQVLVS